MRIEQAYAKILRIRVGPRMSEDSMKDLIEAK